jgi:hypothetical protein
MYTKNIPLTKLNDTLTDGLNEGPPAVGKTGKQAFQPASLRKMVIRSDGLLTFFYLHHLKLIHTIYYHRLVKGLT